MAVEHQVAILYALTNGFLDDVAVDQVIAWEKAFHSYLKSQAQEVIDLITKKKELSDDVVAALEKAIIEFKETQQG